MQSYAGRPNNVLQGPLFYHLPRFPRKQGQLFAGDSNTRRYRSENPVYFAIRRDLSLLTLRPISISRLGGAERQEYPDSWRPFPDLARVLAGRHGF